MYKINLDEFNYLLNSNKEKKSKSFFKGSFEEEFINEDIILIKSNLFFDKDISIQSNYEGLNDAILCLTISTSKDHFYSFKSSKSNINYNIKGDTTNITIVDKSPKGSSHLKGNTHLKNIHINIKKGFLFKNFSEKYHEQIVDFFSQKKEVIKILNHKTNIKSKICANEILKTANNDNFTSLYTQSKVYEILSYELPILFESKKEIKGNIKFDEYDLKALDEVREILLRDYTNPPSISELSKMVKLNEFKLKFGYKNRFNETPYKTIFNCRMIKGKELLENSELNVAEIATFLGYKQLNSFTRGFVETYNIRPRDLIKSRKYYY